MASAQVMGWFRGLGWREWEEDDRCDGDADADDSCDVGLSHCGLRCHSSLQLPTCCAVWTGTQGAVQPPAEEVAFFKRGSVDPCRGGKICPGAFPGGRQIFRLHGNRGLSGAGAGRV